MIVASLATRVNRQDSLPNGGGPDGISWVDEIVGMPYVFCIFRNQGHNPENTVGTVNSMLNTLI